MEWMRDHDGLLQKLLHGLKGLYWDYIGIMEKKMETTML